MFSKHSLKIGAFLLSHISVNADCGTCSMTKPSAPQTRSMRSGLMVFVSSSMPKDSVKQLITDVQKAGGVVIIQGLMDGTFPSTVAFFKEVGGVQMDPHLFQTYKVTTVPTFIVEGEGGTYDRMAGNVSVSYALEQFSKGGDTALLSSSLLGSMRGGK